MDALKSEKDIFTFIHIIVNSFVSKDRSCCTCLEILHVYLNTIVLDIYED